MNNEYLGLENQELSTMNNELWIITDQKELIGITRWTNNE